MDMSTIYPLITDSSRLLQAYRKYSKLTIRKAAEKLGIDYSFLSKIEMAKRKPSIELLSRIAELYSMPLNIKREIVEFYDLEGLADLKIIPSDSQQYTFFAEVGSKHTNKDRKGVYFTWTILKNKR